MTGRSNILVFCGNSSFCLGTNFTAIIITARRAHMVWKLWFVAVRAGHRLNGVELGPCATFSVSSRFASLAFL
ncbi:hypothetical protein EVA_18512 [gut metagenome]|uniref:Uncharacterized protein n=1 Tax=gut metagenome TaxID=749906 RepID=J9FEN7_9ZZZZ